MKVAGLGFTQHATLASLREALALAGNRDDLTAVATVSDKAQTAALQLLACELNLPIRSIPQDVLGSISTVTQSEFVRAKFGTGSVAEAAALAAAGRGARLVATRVISSDRTATAAIAEGEGE
jgi:cobalt-precorrin 5A hydrolase